MTTANLRQILSCPEAPFPHLYIRAHVYTVVLPPRATRKSEKTELEEGILPAILPLSSCSTQRRTTKSWWVSM